MASKNGSVEANGRQSQASVQPEDALHGGPVAGHDYAASGVGDPSSNVELERGRVHDACGAGGTGNDDPAKLARRLLTPQIQNHGCPGDPLWQQFPQLAAMLFRGSWNGIMPRKPAMLTIVVRPTGLQFTFKMPTEGKQVRDNVSFFHDVLPRLEQCLKEMLGDWSDLTNGPGATYKREQRKKLLAKSDSPI